MIILQTGNTVTLWLSTRSGWKAAYKMYRNYKKTFCMRIKSVDKLN